jgi:hypothetical protein
MFKLDLLFTNTFFLLPFDMDTVFCAMGNAPFICNSVN